MLRCLRSSNVACAPGRTLGAALATVLGSISFAALPAAVSASPVEAATASEVALELVRYVGDPSSATGSAIAAGDCDIDGDEISDAIVGGWFWDKAPVNNIGAAYVVLGGETVTSASLASPAEANAIRIDGPAVANSFVGFSVGCLGDVNGDGFDDLAIGHYTAQRTYVIFGAEDFTGLTLDSIGDRGYVIAGGPDSGNVGFSLAGVGDINADGLDDIAVAEVVADNHGRTNNGRVWVLAGREGIDDVNLLAPEAGQVIMTVDGALSEERLGNIASAGDFNGDGVDDFVLGSYTSTPWGAGSSVPGAAYVVFGGNSGVIDAANLGERGLKIVGPKRQRDRLGISVAAAGDLNGDGLDDVIIGADGVTNAATGPRNGGAAVVFGSASTVNVYTDPTAAASTVFECSEPVADLATCADQQRRGLWIDGAASGDSTGFSVAGLDDLNGDDVPDLLLGAYGFDVAVAGGSPMNGAGAAYVVFGDSTVDAVRLATLTPERGFRIDGTLGGDRFGRQSAAIGDIDANGVKDFAVGADFAARPDAQMGELTLGLLGQLNTSIELDAPSVAVPGEGLTVSSAVEKLAGDKAVVETGKVEFSYDDEPIAGCEAVGVVAGSASCGVVFEHEGNGELTATFTGTANLAGSTTSKPLSIEGPNSPVESWVSAVYTDFLRRPPTQTEIDFATAELAAGDSRNKVASKLAKSDQWVGELVRQMYLDTLDREPDVAGRAFWVKQIVTGRLTFAAVGARFYSSAEYFQNSGGTNSAWVTDLYEKILHRAPDAGGLDYWVKRAAKAGRLDVSSNIYSSLESRRDRVSSLYQSLLGRSADPSGLAYWADQISRIGDLRLAVMLATSAEYGVRAEIRFP